PAQQIAWLAEHLGAWYDPTLEEVDLLHDTAYGALTRQTASSEGFAMAFAALLSLLELDVYVVLGALDGVDHVWNIFYLDGYYYHVDVSRLFYFGAEYTLFVSDIEMVQNGYSWDLSRYPQAYGPLPYPLVTS
ncbi:MAG: hypothetical protein FWC72_04030, partial [Oscillospiraceae bacterium]|nr:hypothetical protein [Oscillospiraceae bacterium]